MTARERIDCTRPFTAAQAREAGLSKNDLRSSTYRALHRGVYLGADVEITPVLAAMAAVLASAPTAFASHATAARIWGLPIPTLPGEHVTVTDLKHRRSRPGIACHVSTRTPIIQEVGQIRVSAPMQTFLELAGTLTLVDLVVVGDHVVRNAHASLEELRTFCHQASGSGAAAATRAMDFVRERVDSPMESRLRMLIVLAGLPEPEVNLDQVIAGRKRRFDLCWPRAKVIVEYDGRHHIERRKQWEADLKRREALEAAGWRVLVFVAKDVFTTPGDTLVRTADALRDRGLPGVRRELDPAWRAHFERTAAA